MKKLPNRIETYAEYEELLARLVKASKVISDPLLSDEDRARYMQAYDRIDKLLGDYNERESNGILIYSERMYGKWAKKILTQAK